MRRTRLGKIVGSQRPPLDEWTCWPEQNHLRESGWITVAPSGARMEWFPTEREARDFVDAKNEEAV